MTFLARSPSLFFPSQRRVIKKPKQKKMDAAAATAQKLTAERSLPERLSSVIQDPGRPRFDEAPSVEKPHPEK